jgi:Flp pilus assembly protein CpaB
MAVRVPPDTLAGTILPGARVDILATSPKPGVVKVLLENVTVLAVDIALRAAADRPQPAATVTLAVTVDQARQVGRVLDGGGTVRVVLRPAKQGK